MSGGERRGPEGSDRDVFAGSYTGRPEPGRTRWLLIGLAAASFALVALFFGGEYVQRLVRYLEVRVPEGVVPEVSLEEPVRNIVLNTVAEVPVIPDNLVRDGLPVYDIRMAPADWQTLQSTARIVTAQVIADTVARDYVPAEFWREGEWTPIEVKLRGLYSPHYLLKRPSLRLKFPSDRLFEGKRQLNLLDLYDKGLTYDVTTNWELRRHDVLTWDSQFVVVRLNGDVLGLYQEIEQFGRSLSDRNGRPEGFILSGRGQLFGKQSPGSERALAAFEKMKLCHVTPPHPRCNWEFLRSYFDIDRWAWAGGMTLLLQSHHGWATDNLRVFWDPAWGHFEPIPWDYQLYPTEPVARPDGEVLYSSYAFSFASIPEYRRLRDQRFWYLATERLEPMIAEGQRLFDELRPALSHDLRHLTLAEDERFQLRYGRILRANARYLMDLFEAHKLGVRWWPADASGFATLDASNQGKAFVSLRGAIVRSGGRERRVEFAEPVLVDGMFMHEPGRATARFPLDSGAEIVGIVAQNEVTGAPLRSEEISLFRRETGRPEVVVPQVPPLPEVASGALRVEADRVVLGPGRVDLFRSLEVDRSRDVVFAAGLDLRLAKGTSIVVYGDLESRGTPDQPVRISGAEGWGGVLVHGSRLQPSRVHLEHTYVDGGMGGETERVIFSAPFAVHGGEVTLRHVSFSNSRAVDAVNLKYADIDVSDMLIRGAVDDAFDCDFCRGRVVGSRVESVGGDGLDFSGSNLELSGNSIRGCGDKGISIGEATSARVNHSEIEDCYTGIAVKDRSDAEIRGALLARLEVGVAVYVKKPTFGPSRARVEDVELRDVDTRVLQDESCTLEWIDGS